MDFNETPLPHQEAFDYALFRFEHSIKLMIAHPDWSAADINEVVENMWIDHKEAVEVVHTNYGHADQSQQEIDRESLFLFDREEAKYINGEM
jgi:hypothetical protein